MAWNGLKDGSRFYGKSKWLYKDCDNHNQNKSLTLPKKCPHSELLWSILSCIRTEYGEIQRISLHSIRMRENTAQNNSEYEHFSRNVNYSLSSALTITTFKKPYRFFITPGYGKRYFKTGLKLFCTDPYVCLLFEKNQS